MYLGNNNLGKMYRKHCRKSLNDENNKFIEAYKLYKNIKSRNELISYARIINKKYIDNESSHQINIKYQTHLTITNIINNIDNHSTETIRYMFDDANKQIRKLISDDIIPKFTNAI